MPVNNAHRICCLIVALLLLTAVSALAAAGDSARGKALFGGQEPFEHGGAPCLACHGLSGYGLAAGASYGPDLTTIFNDYGQEGLEGVLQSLAFPSMEAIYAERLPNESEVNDLIAFLQQAAELPPAATGSSALVVQVLVGVLVVLVLTFLVGFRRMRAARQSLIDRQRQLINKGGLQ